MVPLAFLCAALAVGCDPLGSSGDAASCSMCAHVRAICSSPRADDVKTIAKAACTLHPDARDDDQLWLLACDANKMAYGAGVLGFLPGDEQWDMLLSVCEAGATKKALRAACPPWKKLVVGKNTTAVRARNPKGPDPIPRAFVAPAPSARKPARRSGIVDTSA